LRVNSPQTLASRLLCPGLLEGVSVLIGGAPPVPQRVRAQTRAHEPVANAVRSACADLGASLLEWDAAPAPACARQGARPDVVVFDGAGAFACALEGAACASEGTCAPQGARAEEGSGAPEREALDRCMELAWELTRTVADSAQLSAGWAGRIIYIAPPQGAGAHAGGVRAGLENLARTLSIEWARHGVTTTAIAPGVQTAAEEIGALTAYLASPAGAYFSGCLLDLTGPGGAAVSLPG
jgi:NAD(P)-dependent dehydrogenase (short-subunit alcohol dehydrogenase family)